MATGTITLSNIAGLDDERWNNAVEWTGGKCEGLAGGRVGSGGGAKEAEAESAYVSV